MPNPPPPPPPGPPPPPIFASGDTKSSSNDPQARNMLLQSIRQGAKLKKAVTVDKSAPLVGNVKNTSNNSPMGGRSNGGASEPQRNNGGPLNLGGLFAGGMPKLKSTGRAIGGSATSIHSTQEDREFRSNPVINHQQTNSIGSRSGFPSDIKNRGPPPQPPPANRKPSMHTSTSDSVLTASPALSLSHNKSNPPLPNKPPVGGYGKPNVAPRPPNQAPSMTPPRTGTKPSPPPKSPNVQGLNGPPSLPSRPPSVTRAQSMRTPRSPSSGSSTPPDLGEYRGNYFQSTEGLHHMTNGLNHNQRPPRTSTLPSNMNQYGGGGKAFAPQPPSSTRMAPAPPSLSAKPTPIRAPSVRPPPPPSRAAINPPLCPPPPPPTAAPLTKDTLQPPPNTAPPPPSSAPPPPPHRTAPSPAASKLTSRLPSNTMQPQPPPGVPPPPPIRNSSMRNGNAALGDLEARYGEMFHRVQEFPPPEKYLNVPKFYNSRNAKQQAPQPPNRQPSVHVQLSNKMWANDSSTC